MMKQLAMRFLFVMGVAAAVVGCGGSEPIAAERYVETDQLASVIDENLASSAKLSKVADIDHSRMAQQAGAIMPPARVLIFSDSQLESQLIKLNPLVALDLPLRVLAFGDGYDNTGKVIFNSFDYLTSRYQLDPHASTALREKYNQDISTVTNGLPATAMASFPNNTMKPDGIITIASPYGFHETIERVKAAINSQDDTINFANVDFQANALELGIELTPTYMILFGGPKPGGKAMADAPTLGLDAFCQKLLIWEDTSGHILVSFNDLLALADRQGVKKAVALRIINYRLGKIFSDALASEQG
jgi:uncharacterized protein (DUF302 family)